MMKLINIKLEKRCAFCIYWYDPNNRYISPKSINTNLWTFDSQAICPCVKKGCNIASNSLCSEYKCKLPII